ncbi:MAG TPA: glycosyltransferase [Ktedonosporobacter sp.]|nr:glycosyltransferase [Ktedonosporobacter sp.]
MSMLVSVVVPTFKRRDLLDRCIAALVAQSFDPAAYEIVIVDDAACAETRQQVKGWAKRVAHCGHCVRYLPVCGVGTPHGPATARNLGWRAARGEIIAFTDDDCIPTPAWLKAGVAAFSGDIMAVSGRIVIPLADNPTDYEYNASHLANSEFVTANCFYRREALALAGGFDERFTAPWREDSDLFFTLLENNVSYTCAPEAVVVHPVRPARWGISLSQQRKSMFNALLFKKHPRLYWQKIQPSPPWHYYGIVGALLLMLTATLLGSRFFAFCGLGLWGWMTARFCAQRLSRTSRAPAHVAKMLLTSMLIPPLAVFWRLRGVIRFRVLFL